MKFSVTSIVIVILFLSHFKGRSQSTTFNRLYHWGYDNAFNIIETDTGYAAAFVAKRQLAQTEVSVDFLDSIGNITQQKFYGTNNEGFIAYSMVKTFDSNYVVGCSLNTIDTTLKFFLLKVNQQGDSMWCKKISPAPGFYYYGGYVIQTKDSGFLITGQIVNDFFSPTDGDMVIVKTDKDGNEIWHSIYGGSLFDMGYSSVELNDGSFLTLGWTRSYGFGNSNNRDVYLVKTDSAGNFIWQKTFGDTNYETGIGISKTFDDNFILATSKYRFATGKFDVLIYKIDTAGNVIWSKTYGLNSNQDCWWAKECANGDIVSVGSKETLTNLKDAGSVFKTDSLGNLKWDRNFTVGNDHAYFRDVHPTTDGGVICAGFAFDGPNGQDAWLVKLDSLGCDSAGCANYTGIFNTTLTTKREIVNVFPNPAKDRIFISYSFPVFSAAQITVLDILGKQQLQQNIFLQKETSFNISSLAPGIYFIEIKHEGIKDVVKFVKE
jgi:Secretion system C-terminal sorting domain